VFFLSDVTFGISEVSAADVQRATGATLGLLFGQVLTVDEMIGNISAGADNIPSLEELLALQELGSAATFGAATKE
jgi:hypothetical protein